ncbi:energy transducer TonB [Sphingomonas sp. BK069]|uniref:energy transducer TonB n=1 Tax=Sphingomonas sp. BK069 TaxID=2586979 RepID=UPI0018517C77|nr:energy transducer TonB [Sphingomonas sp. BK069]MBB3346714.1 TonB family protein [Sphingomonas sp. BK069]
MMLVALLAAYTQVPPPPYYPHHEMPRQLLSWSAGEVRCDGLPVTVTGLRQPSVELLWGAGQTRASATLVFALDPTGRPTSIRPEAKEVAPSADLAPALAASRFAAGASRTNCAITYTPRIAPLAEAAIADLIAYTLAPDNGTMPQEGWDRVRLAGTCLDLPRPEALLRALPDFRNISATPGARDWTMVRYDTDARGRPRGTHVIHGTGNPALDAAAMSATRASRFTGGARTGCQYPYWLRPAKLVAPELSEAARAAKDGPDCPHRPAFLTPPRLTFPEPYRRRMIEGWAVIRFDVAPWGEIGHLSVVASEPTADFGSQAIIVMRSATLPPSDHGRSGCVDRVRFVMGPDDMPDPSGPPRPSY